MLKKLELKKVLDIFIVVLLFITSIKKGGFYKTDILTVNLIIISIGIVYLAFDIIKNRKFKIDIVAILVFLLGISYSFPILFGNSADISDSIFEMIRYFNLYVIYKIVSNSDNKKVYEIGIVVVTLFECIIGIDGIGNRYLTGILNSFGTGYLSRDFTRMSGTIQYANVFAILCAVSLLILIFNISSKDKIKAFKISSFFFIFSSLILTESRAVFFLFAIILLIYFLYNFKMGENIEEKFIFVVLNIIFSFIYVTYIYNFAMYNGNIYIVTIVFLFLNLILNIVLDKYILNSIKIKSVKRLIIYSFILFVGYIFLGLNISMPLSVSYKKTQEEVTRNIYNISKGNINSISLKVEEKEIDTRYNIIFEQVLDNLEVKEIKQINYYESSSGEFEFDFNLDENAKYIKMTLTCDKGKLCINDMKINQKNIKLNYLLIPSSIVFKLQDVFNNSTSITDRIVFYKDAISIITASAKNFIVGVGGEGFKNTYELYQSQKYISTEVHNSFLQIFVEAGVIGFLTVISIVVYVIYNSKNIKVRLVFMLFVLHSFVDLELSYFVMIFLFGILLGLCNGQDRNSSITNYLKIPAIIILILNFIIIFNADIAYSIEIPEYSGNILDSEQVIKKLETRVKLDAYNIDYRMELNDEYETYLKLLISENSINGSGELDNKITDLIVKIKNNADTMLKNSKYNKFVIVYVNNIYFDNITYFTNLYYSNDIEKGYEEYMYYILENIDKLKNHKYNDLAKEEVGKLYNNYYFELNEKNKYINSLKLQYFVKVLEKMR